MERSRRDFLTNCLTCFAIGGLGITYSTTSKACNDTIMLTQDGQLVRVDLSHQNSRVKKRKVTNQELHEWVKHNKS